MSVSPTPKGHPRASDHSKRPPTIQPCSALTRHFSSRDFHAGQAGARSETKLCSPAGPVLFETHWNERGQALALVPPPLLVFPYTLSPLTVPIVILVFFHCAATKHLTAVAPSHLAINQPNRENVLRAVGQPATKYITDVSTVSIASPPGRSTRKAQNASS